MRFNKEQREGIAKVTDNIATASLVATIVGGIVDHKLGLKATVCLIVFFFVLLYISFNLRKEEVNQNDQ